MLRMMALPVAWLLGIVSGQSATLDDVRKKGGNYSESHERNVGLGSRLRPDRGLNAPWTKGGLMYPIPFR
jgi:hypothetical protein